MKPDLGMLRALAAPVALLALSAATPAALAQSYPSKPVRIILPYAAGGGADVLTRMLGQSLGESWKQSVVIDNRPGAGATIGTDMVAKAAPDGYTLLMTAGTMAVSPAAYPNLPYDVQKSFVPITLVAQSPYVLAVNPKLAAQTVPELLELARRSPGKLNFGSPGKGTLSHLTFELLRNRTGLEATVIHYKGSNPALTAVVAGEVDFVLDTPAAVMQHVNAQKLRALAVSTAKRSASAPDVASMADAGVRDVDVSVWFGLLAPAGTPPDIVKKIRDDVVAALSEPAMVEKLKANGLEVVTSQPAEFAAYLRTEIVKWGELVRKADIKFD